MRTLMAICLLCFPVQVAAQIDSTRFEWFQEFHSWHLFDLHSTALRDSLLFLTWVRSQDFRSSYCVIRPDGQFEIEPSFLTPPEGEYRDTPYKIDEESILIQRKDLTFAYGIDGSPEYFNSSFHSMKFDLNGGVVWSETILDRQDSTIADVYGLTIHNGEAFWVLGRSTYQSFPEPYFGTFWIAKQNLETGAVLSVEVDNVPSNIFVTEDYLFGCTMGGFPDYTSYLVKYTHDCDSLSSTPILSPVLQFSPLSDGFMGFVNSGYAIIKYEFDAFGETTDLDTLYNDLSSGRLSIVDGVQGNVFLVQIPTRIWSFNQNGDLLSSLTELDALDNYYGTVISPGLLVTMSIDLTDTRCALIDQDCNLSSVIELPPATPTGDTGEFAVGRCSVDGYTVAVLHTDPDDWTQSGIAFLVRTDVTEVTEKQGMTEQKVRLYPNPFNSHLSIVLDHQWDINALTIYNALGQRVSHSRLGVETRDFGVTIDFSQLPSGNYYVQSGQGSSSFFAPVLHLK